MAGYSYIIVNSKANVCILEDILLYPIQISLNLRNEQVIVEVSIRINQEYMLIIILIYD